MGDHSSSVGGSFLQAIAIGVIILFVFMFLLDFSAQPYPAHVVGQGPVEYSSPLSLERQSRNTDDGIISTVSKFLELDDNLVLHYKATLFARPHSSPSSSQPLKLHLLLLHGEDPADQNAEYWDDLIEQIMVPLFWENRRNAHLGSHDSGGKVYQQLMESAIALSFEGHGKSTGASYLNEMKLNSDEGDDSGDSVFPPDSSNQPPPPQKVVNHINNLNHHHDQNNIDNNNNNGDESENEEKLISLSVVSSDEKISPPKRLDQGQKLSPETPMRNGKRSGASDFNQGIIDARAVEEKLNQDSNLHFKAKHKHKADVSFQNEMLQKHSKRVLHSTGHQLTQFLDHSEELIGLHEFGNRFVIVARSAGSRAVLNAFHQNPHFEEKVAGLVLIAPTIFLPSPPVGEEKNPTEFHLIPKLPLFLVWNKRDKISDFQKAAMFESTWKESELPLKTLYINQDGSRKETHQPELAQPLAFVEELFQFLEFLLSNREKDI